MDILRLYNDYNIDYRTEGHKHCREGWVNVECPFCSGNPGYHLGFQFGGNSFVCWRCGGHHLIETICQLLRVDKKTALKVIKEYKGLTIANPQPKPILTKKKFIIPSNLQELTTAHKKYLQGRGFDPIYLAKHWGIKSTGPLSFVDNINYSYRIFIPINWGDKTVSFQCRDASNTQDLRYIACPQNREIIEHKHIVYANQKNWEKMKNGTGICVEGVTDVWKLGDFAFATFGIKYKKEQIRLISKHLKRVAVVFDDDPEAIKQATKLVAELQFRGVDAFRIPIVGDPGDMKEDDVKHLLKQIL